MGVAEARVRRLAIDERPRRRSHEASETKVFKMWERTEADTLLKPMSSVGGAGDRRRSEATREGEEVEAESDFW